MLKTVFPPPPPVLLWMDSLPRPGITCGLSLLKVLVMPLPEGFPPGSPFSPPSQQEHSNFQVGLEMKN